MSVIEVPYPILIVKKNDGEEILRSMKQNDVVYACVSANGDRAKNNAAGATVKQRASVPHTDTDVEPEYPKTSMRYCEVLMYAHAVV